MIRRLIALALLMVLTNGVSHAGYPKYRSRGSTFVPLDSWVYPVFDRLAALGYMPTAFAGMRPWTRAECARLVSEASEQVSPDEMNSPAGEALSALALEFAPEMNDDGRIAELESLYIRSMTIAGTPLRDGFHFGQTVINDSGRPYGSGENAIIGFSAKANAGPFSAYARGEYQHVPSVPARSTETEMLIGAYDRRPADVPRSVPATDRFILLDAYGAVTISNTQISFGKQAYWWGPGRGGAMVLSNNAEPFYSVRMNRVIPFKLPSVLGWLGPMRFDSFVGQLSGHRIVAPDIQNVVTGPVRPQPYIHGEKITFKPTPNLEVGLSRTVVFGGPGFPLTAHNLWRSFWSTGSGIMGEDPGDRRSGFDFSYRLPGLRKWVVLYSDSLADDKESPLFYPDWSGFSPGIYLPRLPKLPRVDLRLEGGYTDVPGLHATGFFYHNLHYRDGYTNKQGLMGSWIGRQGRGVHASSTYWLSPLSTVQVGYRNQWINPAFLRGGKINDFNVTVQTLIQRELSIRAVLQYENWNFPVLATTGQSNFAASFQLTWLPR